MRYSRSFFAHAVRSLSIQAPLVITIGYSDNLCPLLYNASYILQTITSEISITYISDDVCRK